MKRSNNFSFLHGVLKSVSPDTVVSPIKLSEDNSELNRLLKIIFAPDDNGVIAGDIGAVLNAKTPPEIVTFVKQVLQQDLSNYRQPSIPDGMSDEFAESLAPILGESKSDYANRVSEIIRYNQNELKEAQDSLTKEDD